MGELEQVIFDVDGTLVDSVDLHARAWQEALAAFGISVAYPHVRAQIGKGADQLIPALVPRERLAEVREPLDAHRAELFKRKYLSQVRGFPKVRELFLRLKADGKRLALATSAKGDERAAYERAAGIEGLVEAATSADEVERSKPHPDLFEAALAELGNPPPHLCAVVGDSPYDAIAARGAHLRTVGLLCGGFDEALLWRAGCVAIYPDPARLLEAYEAHGDAAFTGGLARLEAEEAQGPAGG